MMETQPSSDTFSKRLVAGVVIAYLAMMVVLGFLGFVGFVLKTAILPILFVVALATRSLTPFFKDWYFYLAATILFDSIRGYIWALIKEFDLPVYMGYAITAERLLLGGTTWPELLQSVFYTPGVIGPLDMACAVTYASHFLVFFLFGLVIWYWRREDFWLYRYMMLFVMFVGLAGYLLVPTVPPWMAGNVYKVIPTIHQPGRQIYNVAFPALVETFATNPIAAMPSLHAAFPVACLILAWKLFGRNGMLVLLPYPIAVFFAAGLLGEHYLVDLIAGIALAALAYGTSAWIPRLRAELAKETESIKPGSIAASPVVRVALLGSCCLAIAYGMSNIAIQLNRLNKTFVPSPAFVRSELIGKSNMGHYFLGWAAYERHDYATAREALLVALQQEMPAEPKRPRLHATMYLARSAHFVGDHATAVAAFRRLPSELVDTELEGLYAISQIEIGRDTDGFALLAEVGGREPDNPHWSYAMARYAFLRGRIDRADVESRIVQLEGSPIQPAGAQYAADLKAMLAEPRS